eukprot:scaffold8790_cov187-Amphora_coffeaeformis.AAC.1
MVNPKLCSTCERIYNATGVVPDSIGCPEFRSKALTSLVNSVAKSKASSHKSIYTPVNIITEVYYDDVLCGRGKFANNRPGNRHYRRLLEDHCEAYSKCKTYRSKGHFTRSILQEVKRKGRFLKPLGEGRYVEISDDQGRVKVGQDLRYQYLHKGRRLVKTWWKKNKDKLSRAQPPDEGSFQSDMAMEGTTRVSRPTNYVATFDRLGAINFSDLDHSDEESSLSLILASDNDSCESRKEGGDSTTFTGFDSKKHTSGSILFGNEMTEGNLLLLGGQSSYPMPEHLSDPVTTKQDDDAGTEQQKTSEQQCFRELLREIAFATKLENDQESLDHLWDPCTVPP